jgi:hypothetical protein
MGTSASSNGPGSGVPLVPPWVLPLPAIPPPEQVPAAAPQEGQKAEPIDSNAQKSPVSVSVKSPQASPLQAFGTAPNGRFKGARLNLGKFVGGGSARNLGRGLRDYVRKGYKGRPSAVARFGGTVSTANNLYGALGTGAGQPAAARSSLDRSVLAGRSAREVMDAIVEAVRPVDGTQDAEASRAAIKDALSDVLALFPDADLLNMTEEQRAIAVERFVSIDVYRRALLDIGKAIQAKAPTATVALARFKEVKEYIKEKVGAAFRKLRDGGQRLTMGRVGQVVHAALDATFKVFEEYR